MLNTVETLVRRFFRSGDTAPADAREYAREDFRAFVAAKADVGMGGIVTELEDAIRASIVVAELIRRGRKRVIIYGENLSPDIFLAPCVKEAVVEFLARDPSARLIVVTNQAKYREQLAGRAAVDTSRIDMYPVLAEHKSRYFFKGVVLSDESDKPSYWFLSETRKSKYGVYEFHSPDSGVRLRLSLGNILAKFGSPVHVTG